MKTTHGRERIYRVFEVSLGWCAAARSSEGICAFVLPVSDAQRILAALKDFGFASSDLSVADLEKPDRVVQLGVPPVRVDIVTSIDGVSWEQAWAAKIQGTYGDVAVYFIGRKEFVANKKAVGRRQDLADLEALGEE